ncbi:bacteriocin-like protein [Chryseobacterium sp. JUb7]|uniref:bacteriocin-like protein n=1 Tax=Chryseobacterium sp. JUb7 TaxID=2940599 RepID=UPI002166E865|nr:hypothetical protein [Chryseobacterium sp. JUb7]MCS3529623.1 hypothetical protein [Chryseobacterium sp. JUb7]
MKNLKKISRDDLKQISGGRLPVGLEPGLGTGGCGGSSWCACGSITIDLGLGSGPREECCACPPKSF